MELTTRQKSLIRSGNKAFIKDLQAEQSYLKRHLDMYNYHGDNKQARTLIQQDLGDKLKKIASIAVIYDKTLTNQGVDTRALYGNDDPLMMIYNSRNNNGNDLRKLIYDIITELLNINDQL